MVKKITGDEFNEVRTSKLAVVDFSATWCGPCKMLGPVIEQVSEEMADKAAFFNVDVDDDQDIAEEFNIMSIPAVLVHVAANDRSCDWVVGESLSCSGHGKEIVPRKRALT